jgi:hypothetical protein
MKIFRDRNVLIKGQGARVKIRRKSWLKQLRVAVSTKASMPSGSSPQNSRINFVNLRHNIWSFQKLAKISQKCVWSRYPKNNKTSLTCLEIFMPNGKVGVGVLDRQTYPGGTRGSRLCGEDRDRETENSKVCTRTQDTRFIQVRDAKVANPTSCLGDQVWRPTLGVG